MDGWYFAAAFAGLFTHDGLVRRRGRRRYEILESQIEKS